MPKADPHLKLRQMEVFLEAANCKNFSQAAVVLGITPAALSQAISDLENALGAQLFHREDRARGAKLTPRGEALVDPAKRLLEAARHAREVVAEATLPEGRLVVAYQPILGSTARAALESLLRRQPGLRWKRSKNRLTNSPSFSENGNRTSWKSHSPTYPALEQMIRY